MRACFLVCVLAFVLIFLCACAASPAPDQNYTGNSNDKIDVAQEILGTWERRLDEYNIYKVTFYSNGRFEEDTASLPCYDPTCSYDKWEYLSQEDKLCVYSDYSQAYMGVKIVNGQLILSHEYGTYTYDRIADESMEMAEESNIDDVSQAIVGTWEEVEKGYIVTFYADGTLEGGEGLPSAYTNIIASTWRYRTDTAIPCIWVTGGSGSADLQFSIDGDTLTLSFGKTYTYRRVN